MGYIVLVCAAALFVMMVSNPSKDRYDNLAALELVLVVFGFFVWVVALNLREFGGK